MAKTPQEPKTTVAAVEDIARPLAIQFTDTLAVVLLVRGDHAEADEAELRDAIAASDGIPPRVRLNGKPCGPWTPFALESVPDAPFYVLAFGKGDKQNTL